MNAVKSCILTINGGSSIIKFALYQSGEFLARKQYGNIYRIGLSTTKLTLSDSAQHQQESLSLTASNHHSAAKFLIDWIEKQVGFAAVTTIGHRVVRGMHHNESERVTPKLLDELHRISPYDPKHMPFELELRRVLNATDFRDYTMPFCWKNFNTLLIPWPRKAV